MHYPGALSKINAIKLIEIAIQILGPIHPLHSKLFLSDDKEGPTGRTLEHDQAHMGVGGGVPADGWLSQSENPMLHHRWCHNGLI